jgi:hypothetical protein
VPICKFASQIPAPFNHQQVSSKLSILIDFQYFFAIIKNIPYFCIAHPAHFVGLGGQT